jgi:hypothetical protein
MIIITETVIFKYKKLVRKLLEMIFLGMIDSRERNMPMFCLVFVLMITCGYLTVVNM